MIKYAQSNRRTGEQAKLLNDLGVIQGVSLFFHDTGVERIVYNNNPKGGYFNAESAFSAFTVAELSQMLPDYYPSWRFKVNEKSEDVKWVATVICGPKPQGIDDIHTAHEFDRFGKTQAEALATLLIALLETNVITAEEVNKRLCAAL